jgi:hypothetical protein
MMRKLTISILALSIMLNMFFLYKNRHRVIDKLNSVFNKEEPKAENINWDKKNNDYPISSEGNTMVISYSVFDYVTFLKKDSSITECNKLPDSLFINPGQYSYYGNNYNLEKAGVYRFMYPGVDNEQRIVYNGDVDTLLSSISWIVSHGNSDDGMEKKTVTTKSN